MKFLFHFYDLRQRAGIQRAITELSNALVKAGHEVILAVNTRRSNVVYPIEEQIVVEETLNPEPDQFGIKAWPVRAAWALREIAILKKLIRDHRPSIVVDHGTALGLIYPFRTIEGIPFVLQRHFPVGGFPNGKLLHRLLSVISASKNIVVLTESIAKEMRAQGEHNVTVIPNVLPSAARPAPFSEAVPRRGLLLGRGKTSQKGFDLFLEALAISKTEGWHFQIVGPEVDSDPLLLGLVRELRLQERVDLLPATADPYRLICECSCLIIPSRYEGFGLVAAEALSIGRPVLASTVDGLRDLVIPGVNGMLFRAGDVGDLAAALDTLCREPGKLAEFAEQAPASVQRYRGDEIVEAWCNFAAQLKTAVC